MSTKANEKDKVALYIATHNVTGLKYFGKTTMYYTNEEIQGKYYGSGLHWKRHLKKHGYNVTMNIIGVYAQDEVSGIALKFSKDNNIVNSKEWSNLIVEDGKTGGTQGHSDTTKEKIRQKALGRVGPQHTEEHKQYMSDIMKGRCASLNITIYNSDDVLIHSVNDGFKRFCVDNGYPLQAFEKSYKTGKRVYENLPNNTLGLIKSQGNDKYIGWKCVKH